MFQMHRTRISSLLSVVATVLACGVAMSHEGHGHPGHQHGASHYVVNPSHSIPIATGVAVTVMGALMLRRSLRSRDEI
jgi:hypothetical protein